MFTLLEKSQQRERIAARRQGIVVQGGNWKNCLVVFICSRKSEKSVDFISECNITPPRDSTLDLIFKLINF